MEKSLLTSFALNKIYFHLQSPVFNWKLSSTFVIAMSEPYAGK